MGALFGLAGSGGAKTFGAGAGGGAAGVIEEKRHEQQLQFESVKAADTHILASKQAAEADSATAEHKAQLIIHQQEANEWADSHGQPRPFSIEADNPADMHAQAVGGLQTLANANGGQIPGVTTTNAPVGAGQGTHKIDVYAPTVSNVKASPNAALDAINTWRKVQNPDAPPISWQDLQIQGGQAVKGNVSAGISRMWQEAQQGIMGLPALSTEKTAAGQSAENAATSAHLQQQLDRYKASPNADASTVKALQAQLSTFNSSAENARSKASSAEAKTTTEQGPAQAAVAGQKTAAQEAAKIDPRTEAGRLNLQEKTQNIIDKKYNNLDKAQKSLFESGVNPSTGERLNLSNAPDEALMDSNTHQPIPTKMLSTLKPTQQESNRADFARSALHSLDLIDGLKAKGKLPNGPISGWTTKALEKVGLNGKDAADAIGLVALTQSAATGAHVGGRFSHEILDKMTGLLSLNANDSQFEGQTLAIRQVMEPYAQQGGRETVGQYKQKMIGSVQTLKNGSKVQVTGLDKNGNFTGTPVQ